MGGIRYVCFLFSFVFAFSANVTAQEPLAIGQWRSWLPYQAGRYVTQSAEAVWYATELSVMRVDKADFSLDYLSKVEGLSGVGVHLVKYHPGAQVLMVIYDDGVIDLVRETEVLTVPGLAESNIIIGEKRINDVFCTDTARAWLAGNFGLSRFDVRTGLFEGTTRMPVEARSVVTWRDSVWVSTDEGLYAAPLQGVNLDDFGNWRWLGPDAGFPADYSAGALAVFADRLYLNMDGRLVRYADGQLTNVHQESGMSLHFLTAEGAHLVAGFRCNGDCNGRLLYFTADGQYEPSAAQCVNRPLYAVEDEQGRVWIADEWRKFRLDRRDGSGECYQFATNTPWSANTYDIELWQDEVWIAAGGVSSIFGYLFRSDGIMARVDGQWNAYNKFTRDELNGLEDFLAVRIHPQTGVVYAGSFLDGLVVYDRQQFKVYNDTNSTLNNAIGDPLRTRVSGLALDAEGNLWVANHSAERPFSVLRPDGTWQSFAPECVARELAQVVVDLFGYKWFVVTNNNAGVLVYDDGGTLDDPSDDRCRLFTALDSELPTNKVNCLAVDLDGAVWVGTNEGPVIFECDPFFDQCTGSRRIVEQDNFGAYLLEDEDVRTIAVDGANRKWVGTTNGVFVLSPDGLEEEARFTTDNSPLFDNLITDIAIHPETGEVYIGTGKGMLSLKAEATEGGPVHRSEVKVYPNPVRPDYEGPIAIEGLARDANVKITDLHGQLVYETTALGGRAIWYGTDYNGRRVQSGVYLVFATSDNIQNPDTAVARILVIH